MVFFPGRTKEDNKNAERVHLFFESCQDIESLFLINLRKRAGKPVAPFSCIAFHAVITTTKLPFSSRPPLPTQLGKLCLDRS